MKNKILFLPAAIRSHVVPAIYLADSLKEQYDITFAVTNDVLAELVVSQGFGAVRTGNLRVGLGMEGRYIFEKIHKIDKWQTWKAVVNDDLLHLRQQELFALIDDLRPSAIFIDIFNSTDILVIYARYKHMKLLFLNPMLSTYRVNGFPAVHEGQWPVKHHLEEQVKRGLPLKFILTNPLEAIISKSMERQFKRLNGMGGFSARHPLAKDRTSALLFDDIPEIILAPLELEVSPEVRKPNQHYLGLCISEERIDTELDHSFAERFETILKQKKSDTKLIYCTFGTFYQGSDKALLDFLNKLLEAIGTLDNVIAVFSVNQLVIETLTFRNRIPNHIHLFSRVPQLRVLQYADLFVTHGGLGSVKESIHYEVPMLVYPLDLHYDQNGNGLKVEHHGLGLRGVFQFERSKDMQSKMRELLHNPKYKLTVTRMRERLRQTYESGQRSETIHQILNSL